MNIVQASLLDKPDVKRLSLRTYILKNVPSIYKYFIYSSLKDLGSKNVDMTDFFSKFKRFVLLTM